MKTPRHLKVSIACLRLPVASFLMCGRSIVFAMQENNNYPDPYPPLATITSALDDLARKIPPADDGSRQALAARNSSWLLAGSLLRQLATYVQGHCENDLTILLSSGFVATKARSRIGQLSAPQNLRYAYTGKSGMIKLRFKPVHGVTAGYTIQVAEGFEGPYVDAGTYSESRILLQGLTPMKTCWIRVRANGAAGPSGWSNPLQVVVI